MPTVPAPGLHIAVRITKRNTYQANPPAYPTLFTTLPAKSPRPNVQHHTARNPRRLEDNTTNNVPTAAAATTSPSTSSSRSTTSTSTASPVANVAVSTNISRIPTVENVVRTIGGISHLVRFVESVLELCPVDAGAGCAADAVAAGVGCGGVGTHLEVRVERLRCLPYFLPWSLEF